VAQISNYCANCGGNLYFLGDLAENAIPHLLRYRNLKDALSDYHASNEEDKKGKRWKGFCEYCRQISPPVFLQTNEEKLKEAIALREKFEFQSAVDVCRDILTEDTKNEEAYWLRALSSHHIADSEDGLYFFGTPHSMTPLSEDEDVRHACNEASLCASEKVSYYRKSVDRLDHVRAEYLALRKNGVETHICLCVSPEYLEQGKQLKAEIDAHRDDLKCFVGSANMKGSSEADEAAVCHAVHSANVMVVLGKGTNLNGTARSRYWKPFTTRDNVRIIVVTDGMEIHPDLVEDALVLQSGNAQWVTTVLKEIEKKYPAAKTNTIIQKEIVVTDGVDVPTTVAAAYQSFMSNDYQKAYAEAEKVLSADPENVPARYIHCCYLTFVQNTSNRDAVNKFFNHTASVQLNADDAKLMKNLFLATAGKLGRYEELAVRMIMRSETPDVITFAEMFCVKIIEKQTSRDFLTASRCALYCELAEKYTAPKICLALLARTKNLPDSPGGQGSFRNEILVRNFRTEYFIPIGNIISSMKNEAVRAKYQAAYRNELMKYDRQAQLSN